MPSSVAVSYTHLRLIFPTLEIARRPVVEQAQSKDVPLGVLDGYRGSNGVPGADEYADFKLEIQPAARTEDRREGALGQALTDGPVKLLSRDADGRTSPMVGNRNPAVVRQERIVGAKLTADRRRMVDGRIEIRVVADAGGQCELGVRLGDEVCLQRCGTRGFAAQRGRKAAAQARRGIASHGHEAVQCGLAAGRERVLR